MLGKGGAAYCLSLGSELICRQEEGIILSINMFLDILLGLLCEGTKNVIKKKKNMILHGNAVASLSRRKKRQSNANANAGERRKSFPLASTEPLMTRTAHKV